MANNVSILEAILKINPDAKVSVNAEDFEQITWHDNTTPISKTEIETAREELQNQYNLKQYQRDRKKEYPSILDQLDDIYHNGVDGWKTSIKAVKDKYPKE
nr:hypothetical protein [uncultured Mediterranean phage uvMED]